MLRRSLRSLHSTPSGGVPQFLRFILCWFAKPALL